jgi:hypothetical protein
LQTLQGLSRFLCAALLDAGGPELKMAKAKGRPLPRRRYRMSLRITRFAAAMAAFLLLSPQAVAAGELRPPVACDPGVDCFLQQTMDMLEGGAVADAFCGSASYDGHTGLDIRVLSMADIVRGVPVLAMADGTVAGLRDGMPDRLVATEQDRAAIADRECGNGVLLDHGGGLVTQYCHLREGSVAVKEGDAVRAGDRLGEVGASGFAQFPHVHAEMRLNGRPVDILRGSPAGADCNTPAMEGAPLLDAGFAAALGDGDALLLAAGLAGEPPRHDDLAAKGPPAPATSASPATVGWAWFANLRKGDTISVRLVWPDGVTQSQQTIEPLDRNKADYSLYAGRGRQPVPGVYRLELAVMRDGKAIRSFDREFEVR